MPSANFGYMHLLHMTRSITTSHPTRLRELYEAAGLKRYDIATLLRRDQSMVLRYETGATPIPPHFMRLLAAKFGVSVERLMGWDEEAA